MIVVDDGPVVVSPFFGGYPPAISDHEIAEPSDYSPSISLPLTPRSANATMIPRLWGLDARHGAA